MAKRIVEISTDEGKIYVEADVDEVYDQMISASQDGLVKASGKFEESLNPIVNVSKEVLKKVTDSGIRKPSEIELTFGLKFSAKVNVWVISGDGEGSISLSLKWKSE